MGISFPPFQGRVGMPVVLASLSDQFGRHRYLEAWKMTLHCVTWCIWKKCNSCNFEDCERRVITLKDILFKTLYGWMVITNSSRFANFVVFMDMCSFLSS